MLGVYVRAYAWSRTGAHHSFGLVCAVCESCTCFENECVQWRFVCIHFRWNSWINWFAHLECTFHFQILVGVLFASVATRHTERSRSSTVVKVWICLFLFLWVKTASSWDIGKMYETGQHWWHSALYRYPSVLKCHLAQHSHVSIKQYNFRFLFVRRTRRIVQKKKEKRMGPSRRTTRAPSSSSIVREHHEFNSIEYIGHGGNLCVAQSKQPTHQFYFGHSNFDLGFGRVYKVQKKNGIDVNELYALKEVIIDPSEPDIQVARRKIANERKVMWSWPTTFAWHRICNEINDVRVCVCVSVYRCWSLWKDFIFAFKCSMLSCWRTNTTWFWVNIFISFSFAAGPIEMCFFLGATSNRLLSTWRPALAFANIPAIGVQHGPSLCSRNIAGDRVFARQRNYLSRSQAREHFNRQIWSFGSHGLRIGSTIDGRWTRAWMRGDIRLHGARYVHPHSKSLSIAHWFSVWSVGGVVQKRFVYRR